MISVRYLVDGVDQAVEFYTKNLGFSLEDRWGPAFAVVSKSDLRLWLSGPQTSAARAMPDGAIPRSGGWNRIVLEVEDIEAEIRRLKLAGVRFRNEVVTGPGGSQVLIEDPSGNPVELFQAGS